MSKWRNPVSASDPPNMLNIPQKVLFQTFFYNYPISRALQRPSNTLSATPQHVMSTWEDKHTPQVYDSIYSMMWDRG